MDALAATDTLRRQKTRSARGRQQPGGAGPVQARYRGGVDNYLRYLDAQLATSPTRSR